MKLSLFTYQYQLDHRPINFLLEIASNLSVTGLAKAASWYLSFTPDVSRLRLCKWSWPSAGYWQRRRYTCITSNSMLTVAECRLYIRPLELDLLEKGENSVRLLSYNICRNKTLQKASNSYLRIYLFFFHTLNVKQQRMHCLLST